jgi:hypothetical protein
MIQYLNIYFYYITFPIELLNDILKATFIIIKISEWKWS